MFCVESPDRLKVPKCDIDARGPAAGGGAPLEHLLKSLSNTSEKP